MDKLTAKKLVMIRNIIIVLGIVVAFTIWLFIPSLIENNRLVHVGNGRFGSKIGFLLCLGFPLFALIPPSEDAEEIHTDNPTERAQIADERAKHAAKKQIAYATGEALTACLCMILALVLG